MCENKEKLSSRIQRYFSNLWLALCGADPFREELAKLTADYEKTAENVRRLNEMYYQVVEKWDAAEKRLEDYQVLVENLRERIREKDAEIENAGKDFRERMERMKADYQKRIEQYTEEIDRLKNK